MKLKPLFLTICLIVLAAGEAAALTQNAQLVVNELKVFPVYKLKRVAVGDPAIADVTVLSERELMLIAKKAGATSLIIWDEAGQRSFNITVIGKDLEKIAQRIRGLLISSDIRGVRVKTEEDNIYVMGEVLNQRELDKVKDALAPFANVVNLVNLKERQPLVEIDIDVLEVSCDDLKNLGLDWSNSLPVKYSEPTGSSIDGKTPKLWKVFRWDRTTIDARLNFLITEGKARTLANPKLITLSGKEASFLVGGEVGYPVVETEGRSSVQWKDYGVNLKINPSVNSKNEINVKIKAEVSGLDEANKVGDIPALKKREVETELFLNEGETIFLAGLIKNEDSRNVDRLPWLSRIPVLGELFKSTQFKDKRTELVISLTPRIIGERADLQYIAGEMLKQEAILATQRRPPAYSEEEEEEEEESSPFAYYSSMVETIIASRVAYPAQAQEAQQEGTVKIDLHLLSNGRLKEASIRESSGYSSLDEAALSAVQDVAAYPSFPSQITQKELRLSVPVVFKSYVKNE
ncbi:MAG: TonB family protein [Candidatus Omnitrophica bacterium]|nr:TonB family protein [Candidatus Omnitrophota bacterium]